jgi:hypothetical protein
VVLGQIAPSAWWKNSIVFPDDPFAVAGTSSNDPGWVKFAILLPPYDPGVVYFQDCRQYPFHYDFAVNHLDPFLGMTRPAFDAVSLYAAGQQVVMGAVILPPTAGWPPPPTYPEYGIELVRRDAYTPEQVQAYFNAVRAAVQAAPNVKAYYFPSYEQIATARAHRDWLASQGIEIGSAARWAEGNVAYSTGWALGTLKFFHADDIQRAFLLGQLNSRDILLTDGIPAEIPLVAGVITSAPSTPNSHVAILAQTFRIPFAYLALQDDVQKAESLVGRDVVLRVYKTWDGTDVRLIDATGQIDEATKAEILALKRPGELTIPVMTPYGAWSANTDALNPSDIKYFGGKAANYGLLRTSIPDNCPRAVAFSFDLWNAFCDQTIYTGRTLREEIALRLSGFTWPPPDMAALSTTLDNIQALFTQPSVTSFSAEVQNAVLATLLDPRYGFDPNRNMRFRSSTNVEDSEQFTGAGLYDSYSGCLADDLDADGAGPCRCDPVENNERGVFRAIRRVFASFYNNNAYLERLRWGVNESEVGMGLLVHHSFPDEIEMANGVATLAKTYAGSTWHDITLVTQLGAVSVSNPTDGSIPEEVSLSVYSNYYYPTLVRESNLVPRGSTVMTWQQDYIDLAKLLVQAGDRFEAVTGKTTYLLDFEYKKDAPDGDLVVKQIRQLPRPDTTANITPFLLNEPVEYTVFQGEFGDVFANHRLKSLWHMQTRNTWLTVGARHALPSASQDLSQSLYSDVALDYLHGCDIRLREGGFEPWPEYRYSFAGNTALDAWTFDDLRNMRRYVLTTSNVGVPVSQAQSPILTLRDMGDLILEVTYDEPVPTWDYSEPGMTTTDWVRLCPRPAPRFDDIPRTRTFADLKQGIAITTSFYWPSPPKGPVAGYTAPLARWDRTTIEGLTSEPIVLRGDYSQTYKPEHHNFGEHFIFEPRLEDGISPALLNELRLKDIRLILMNMGWEDGSVIFYGFDKGMAPTDLDGDGSVDATDLGLFGRFWRQTGCGRCGGADRNGDGNVGVPDLAVFAQDWLTTYY